MSTRTVNNQFNNSHFTHLNKVKLYLTISIHDFIKQMIQIYWLWLSTYFFKTSGDSFHVAIVPLSMYTNEQKIKIKKSKIKTALDNVWCLPAFMLSYIPAPPASPQGYYRRSPPQNTRRSQYVGLLLCRLRIRWASINPNRVHAFRFLSRHHQININLLSPFCSFAQLGLTSTPDFLRAA